MGWTPSTGNRSAGAADEAASPSPTPRRRRRTAVVAAGTSETPLVDAAQKRSPKQATGMRPASGRKNPRGTAPEDRDNRVQAKVKLGKRWSEIVLAVKAGEYTWAEFVEDRDEEELARGQLRDVNGEFRGRPPALVPREFLLACQREQKRRFEEIFGSEVLGMAKAYVALAKDVSIPADKRAKMLQYAMERVFGGIPKDVRISQEQPWEQMIMNVVTEEGEDMPTHLRRRYAGYAERQGSGIPEENE